MHVRKSFHYFVLQLLPFLVSGQQLQFRNMADRVMLPSQECYNVCQDSRGFLWIGTEQGLCIWDGNSMRVFDGASGLPEGAVYSIAEDQNRRLWMVTSKNRILVYENGKLFEAAFSKQYQKALDGFDITYQLSFSNSGLLYINSENHTYTADTRTGKLTKISGKTSTDFSMIYGDGPLIPTNAYHSTCAAIEFKLNTMGVNMRTQNGGIKHLTIPKNNIKMPTRLTVSNRGSYFAIANKLVKVTPDLQYSIAELPQRVLSVYVDHEGNLWVGTLKQGVYFYAKGDLSSKPIISLNTYSVSGILEDAEKNIWCTTLEKGLFMCRNKNIINYFNIPGLDKPVDMLKSMDGSVYCSATMGKIVKLKADNASVLNINTYSKEPVCDILKNKDIWYIGGQEMMLKTNESFSNLSYLTQRNTHAGIGILQLRNSHGRLFAMNNSDLFEILGNELQRLAKFSSRARCFEIFDVNNILCGRNDGLYLLDVDKQTSTKIAGINSPVTKIVIAPSGVWVATKGAGLYRYSNRKVERLAISIPAQPTVFYDLAQTGAMLWAASNKGLVKITKEKSGFATVIYTKHNGLPSNDIYKIEASEHQLFLSTAEGVCAFQLNTDFSNATPPPIYLQSVVVNGKTQPLQNQEFDYDQNSIHITFAVPSYNEETKLYYLLEGQSNKFVTSSGNAILLDHLVPASYKLIVYARNSDGVKSIKPVIIDFQINKPYWSRWWFIALSIIFVGCIAYWLVRKKIRNIKMRETEKSNMQQLIAQSQLTALQAQMNPHFIFNSINSIQNYILTKKDKEAYSYLAQFSKLIRLVLNNSQKQMLSLHEELETLKLYIELEQLRFSDSFEFNLIVSSNVDLAAVQIPTMIIQPYIENAIWHGIMNLEQQRKGVIAVAVSCDNNIVQIVITDNGVGRSVSAAYKIKNVHQPVAMQLNQERLSIVNSFYKNGEITITIDDLFEDGQASGTKVTVTLPV